MNIKYIACNSRLFSPFRYCSSFIVHYRHFLVLFRIFILLFLFLLIKFRFFVVCAFVHLVTSAPFSPAFPHTLFAFLLNKLLFYKNFPIFSSNLLLCSRAALCQFFVYFFTIFEAVFLCLFYYFFIFRNFRFRFSPQKQHNLVFFPSLLQKVFLYFLPYPCILFYRNSMQFNCYFNGNAKKSGGHP